MADTWSGGVVSSMNGDEPPTVPTWEDVSVPGRASQFADETAPIAYRRRFPDPRQDDERAELELAGVFGRAHVWINDAYLGEHDGPIESGFFPFEPESTNELVIACEPSASTAALAEREDLPDAAAVPGIRGGVTVHRRSGTALRSMAVRPHVADGTATLAVSVTVETADPVDDVLTFSLRPNGFRGGGSMDRTPVEAPGDERTTVETTIEVRDPSLWWPRELGPQQRYTLRAKLGEQSIERAVGLRTVERDAEGLRVNGHPVPARGFTVAPDVPIPAAIEAAVEANATLLRFPAHVPDRSVYEACDEAGLLVWQDLPIPTGFDVDRATEIGAGLSRSRGHHPSLATIGIQDAGAEPFEEPLGSGLLAKLRLRWRAWRTAVDRDSADAVAAALDEAVPSVPLAGAPGTGADVLRLAPGWRYLEPADADWLLDRYVDETTIGCSVGVPADSSPDRGAPTRELSPEDQARALKTVTESLRRRRSGLVLVETLFDAGGDDALGVCTADGDPRPAFEAVGDAYEPIQAVVEGQPQAGAAATVWVLNETTDGIEAAVTWNAGGETGALSTAVPPNDVAAAGSVTPPGDATELSLTVETGDAAVSNQYQL